MDIFVQRIPFMASELDLIEFFATRLHSPEFTQRWPGAPINFKVTVHKDKKRMGYRNGGTMLLSLPYAHIAHDFIHYYGQSLSMLGQHLRLSPSIRPMVVPVGPLRETPYQDPAVLRTKERLDQDLKHTFPINQLQFGWMDRDGVFSIEWDRRYDGAASSLGAEIGFKSKSREVFIEEDTTVMYSDTSPRIVLIKISSVEKLRKQSSNLALLFTLRHAPTFEEKPRHVLDLPHGNIGERRTRQTSMSDAEHFRVVQYTSLALRVVFNDPQDVRRLLSMAAKARLPPPSTMFILPDHRRHFAVEWMNEFDRWINQLDWPVAFQCAALLSHLRVSAKEMIVHCRVPVEQLLAKHGSVLTAAVLRRFSSLLQPGSSHSGLHNAKNSGSHGNLLRELLQTAHNDHLSASSLDTFIVANGPVACYHATITPTGVILDGPQPEQSNRVLRRYKTHQDCFLRVNFADEEKLQYRWDREVDGGPFVRKRVGETLKKPLIIAGRAFEFLAYSMSALKEHAVWFVTPFVHDEFGVMTAHVIRSKLGNFDAVSNCPARYAARISQGFSATDHSITLKAEEIIRIPDIETTDENGETITFTDGVGTMSRETARRIGLALAKQQEHKRRARYKAKQHYCVFQVRIGGSKGMLSVDYGSNDSAICLRPSMEKFDAPDSLDIEVAGTFERPGPMYLNRPLIMVLETLGVPIQAFMTLQANVVADIKLAPHSLKNSAKLLQTYGLGGAFRLQSVLLNLAKLGLEHPPTDNFFKRGMNYVTNDALRGLKHKARIPVPDSFTLVGVADIHGVLKEGQIFVRLRDKNKWDTDVCLKGTILITRSPVAHPGDVQLVEAVGHPPPGSEMTLGKLFNTVVFACEGERSLPQSLGGGDLDGDLYNVITKQTLYPPEDKIVTPASYPKAKLRLLSGGRTKCTVDDIADFVVDYIQNDHIGLISHQSLVIADQCGEQMMRHPDCLHLAELATQAVDFAKSGFPADLTGMPKLHYHQRPDWSAGEMVRRNYGDFYKSTHALGVLFRMIELPTFKAHRDDDTYAESSVVDDSESELLEAFDDMVIHDINNPQLMSDEISQVIKPAVEQWIPITLNADIAERDILPQFNAFSTELQYIAANCSISSGTPLSEEECWAGTIVAKSSQHHVRQDCQARLREQCSHLVTSVRAMLMGSDEEELDTWLHRTWVAWLVSRSLGMNFGARSYGYIALGSMFEVLKDLEEREAF